MAVPNIRNAHDPETRNVINRAIQVLNRLGIDVQTLVADGQLTPNQFSELITVINGHLKSGEVGTLDLDDYLRSEINKIDEKIDKGEITLRDLNKNFIKFDATWFSNDFLEQINNVELDVTNVLPESITSREIAKNGVTPTKASFIKVSTNLADKNSLEFGKNVDLNTGEEINSSVASLSPYIEINSSDDLYSIAFSRVSYYDGQRNFIGANTGNGQLSIPGNARFLRYSTTNPDGVQLNIGTSRLPYEEYFAPYLDGIAIREIIGRIIKGTNIEEKSIGAEHLSIVEESSNLINKSKLIEGYTIAGSSGELIPTSNQNVSEFIKVNASSNYVGNIGRHAEYDQNKNFIVSMVYSDTSIGNVFETRTNTEFIRVVYSNSQKEMAQLNEGTERLPYEEYKLEINRDLIPINSGGIAPDTIEKYMFDNPFTEIYSDNQTYPSYLNLGTTPASEIYAMFDAFMSEYPSYIKKTELGKPSNDSTAQTISYYRFTPPTPERTTECERKKVFIVCGTHGHEHITSAIAYHTLRNVCEIWDTNTSLENLKYNVEYIVIPVLNTSGWDVHERVNANGVDLNRNFPVEGWSAGDPTTTTWGGNAPASENETQYVMQIIDDNPNIDLLIDFHNYHGTDSTTTFLWLVTNRQIEQNLSQNLLQLMTRKWRKEYDFIPKDESYFVGTTSGQSGGLMATYGEEQGIPISLTYEQCWRWRMDDTSQNYDNTAIVTGIEAFTNWLILCGRYFSK